MWSSLVLSEPSGSRQGRARRFRRSRHLQSAKTNSMKTGIQPIALALLSFSLIYGTSEAKPGNGKDKGRPPGKEAKGKSGKGGSGKGPGQASNVGKKAHKQASKQTNKQVKRILRDSKKREIARFRNTDRDHVVGYFNGYRDREHGLPPGLAKNLRRGKPLPPGWRDKLSSGYVIEEPWWASFTPVPYSWFPGVPVREEVGLYWYGDRIVRVYEPRREIIEVIIVPTIHIDL